MFRAVVILLKYKHSCHARAAPTPRHAQPASASYRQSDKSDASGESGRWFANEGAAGCNGPPASAMACVAHSKEAGGGWCW